MSSRWFPRRRGGRACGSACPYEAEARTIQDLYLAGRKEEAAAAVPAEFLELSSLVGPAGHVKERVEAYREAGVTMLNVTPVGPDPVGDVRTLREWLG